MQNCKFTAPKRKSPKPKLIPRESVRVRAHTILQIQQDCEASLSGSLFWVVTSFFGDQCGALQFSLGFALSMCPQHKKSEDEDEGMVRSLENLQHSRLMEH